MIRIDVAGMHLGITYDAQLSTLVDASGNLNITPMTSLLTNGITAGAIAYLLDHYAAITIDAADVRDDPMSGLNLSNSDSIAKIRGAICTYCLLQIISRETGSMGYFDLATIESGGSGNIPIGLGEMGNAVRSSLNDGLLAEINVGITSEAKKIYEDSSHFVNPSLAPANATIIADTAFVITRWVMTHSIGAYPGYDPTDFVLSSIEAYAADIGQRNYIMSHRTDTLFTIPAGAPPGPFPVGPVTWQDLVDNGAVPDAYYHATAIVSNEEVNENVAGYIINYFTGTIEPVLKQD